MIKIISANIFCLKNALYKLYSVPLDLFLGCLIINFYFKIIDNYRQNGINLNTEENTTLLKLSHRGSVCFPFCTIAILITLHEMAANVAAKHLYAFSKMLHYC